MKIKNLLSFLFFFSITSTVIAQNITIIGNVKDAETKEGLPSCNIFVNSTTIGVNSDLEGNFRFNGLNFSEFDLVFTYVGYVSVTKKIVAKEGETITVNVELKPSDNMLTEVQVKSKRDKKWEKQLKKFKNYFLGYSEFADKCEIENAWVIDFEETDEGFSAKAQEPIKIVNTALGYQVSFELIDFFVGKDVHRIGGNVYFTELVPNNKAKLEEWYANRALSYKKSPAFLFKSLIDNKLEGDRLQLYIPKPGSNAIRTDNFDIELGKSVISFDTKNLVGNGKSPEIKKIYIPNELEVHNQGVKSDLRTYQGVDYGISWMQVKGNNVYVNTNGMPFNVKDIVVSGDMDYLKVSGILPTDYDPSSSANEAYFLKFEKPPFAEKVHLHTDRTAYFQGDKIWYKAYLNYTSFAAKDSASKVLYVQLINPNQEILENQKLEVSNGFAYGNIELPADLPKGNYQIRGFTNYMRNFDGMMFSEILPVFSRNEMPEYSTAEPSDSIVLRVLPEIDSYDLKTGEFTLSFKDLAQNPMGANFSVSVNNPNFAPEFDFFPKISSDLNLKEVQKVREFPYRMEYGLEIDGVFLDKKRVPQKGELNVFVNNLQNFSSTSADASGNFVFKNLSFYGDADIYLQPVSKKQKENIFIIKNDNDFPKVSPSPKIDEIKKKTSNLPYFEDIKEEELVAAEEKKVERNTQKMLYGKADYVIEESEINYNNGITGVINSILRKVPSARNSNGSIVLRGGAASVFNSNFALVLIDGVPMGSLNSVQVNNIAKIEVVSRMAPMYGDLGKNGIVSIFLKDKKSANEEMIGKNFTQVALKGYNRPEVFIPARIKMINETNKPTIYWNPEVITNEKGLGHFSIGENATLPLKVCIEGVTQNNIPFRKVFYLK
ncbi:hypothetical protein EGI22_19280 [Lacihabitans sp. LS3-19]|uniref:carboxypeptidase-like regulatory domain-containing protein n=1 Tax=Lacihabitans sp. LS3-19 TaxID=2487335 RepID=UPI0020CD66E3|nr:carboxypeptidase-like regulatory domain-containing protein [Lacihabitans sp. LS3-19]MCP9770051.1 hypothetical protein [Lacihabitans sp. LS3-19]